MARVSDWLNTKWVIFGVRGAENPVYRELGMLDHFYGNPEFRSRQSAVRFGEIGAASFADPACAFQLLTPAHTARLPSMYKLGDKQI